MVKNLIMASVLLLLLGGGLWSYSKWGGLNSFKARVTFYTSSPVYGKNVASEEGKAVHLKTCAVDPDFIPYGTVLKIEGLPYLLTAIDTGPAVISRKASRGHKLPVIDVYVSSQAEVAKYEKINWKENNGICKVTVVKGP